MELLVEPQFWGVAQQNTRVFHNFRKTPAGPRGWGKRPFSRGKNPWNLFAALWLIENTFCKKKLGHKVLRTLRLSSGQSNLNTPLRGHHHQLDDQQRNQNINNRDHLCGQLAKLTWKHSANMNLRPILPMLNIVQNQQSSMISNLVNDDLVKKAVCFGSIHVNWYASLCSVEHVTK